MKKKLNATILVACIVTGLFGGIILVTYHNNEETHKIPYDIGSELRAREVSEFKPISNPSSQLSAVDEPKTAQDGEYYQVGDTQIWYALDDYNEEVVDGYFETEFELRAIGTVGEVWVQADLSYPNSQETPVITDEQVQGYLEVFETIIYPTTTEYFGTPNFHDGSNAVLGDQYYEETGRSVILVSNIRDQAYYDQSYPYFIVGFYWGVFEQAFDRNIVSIDAEYWDTAIEMFEATLAHEYQHLIHADYNPEDPAFMNEGCSMYAETLCGYNVPWGDVEVF